MRITPFLALAVFALATLNSAAAEYAVVVDKETQADSAWAKVTDALIQKHKAALIVYDGEVENALPELREVFPKYACFVTKPEKANTPFVVRVNRLIRQLDSDPYADAVHAILTGYDAAAALQTALATEPKIASTALLSCGVGPARFKDAAFISDGSKGRYGRKFADGRVEEKTDTSNKGAFFAEMFETLAPDVIMTSSHGSQVNIEMPFGEGSIVAKNGKMWRQRDRRALIDYTTGQAKRETIDNDRLIAIQPATKPNIFFAFGNCLTGDIHKPDCLALDAMRHFKSTQFIGYCYTTWYGLQGNLTLWGWEQGGGYTPLNEAHYFANQTLLYRLGKAAPELRDYPYKNPSSNMSMGKLAAEIMPMIPKGGNRQQCLGMVWDRDCVAFYGDPKHACYLDKDHTVKPSIITELKQEGNRYTFTLKALEEVGKPGQSTAPRGHLFAKRLKNIKVIEGAEHDPIIADNFILVDKPGPIKKGESIKIVFEAEPI